MDDSTSPATDGGPAWESTVPAAFGRAVELWPERIAFRSIGGDRTLTWAEADRRVRDLAAGLAARGVVAGDKIAMLLSNSIECHLLDHAATALGAVPFAIFGSSSPEQIAYQTSNAGATIIIADAGNKDRVTTAVALIDQQPAVLYLGGDGDDSVARLEQDGAHDDAFDLPASRRGVDGGDLATLIYTSGTTGKPKAVEWTHASVMAQLRAFDAAIPLSRSGIVSFLPLAHSGGRANALYGSLVHGATLTECPDPARMAEAIVDAQPDTLFSTPRLFEKLRAAIETQVEAQVPERRDVLRRVIEIGMQQGAASDRARTGVASPAREDLDFHAAAVSDFVPILRALGLGRLRSAFVGGAPSAPELTYFFRAVGVPLLEAYGATETGQIIFNRTDDFTTGTAGIPLPGVELKLDEDGELLARSEINMRGYLNRPDDTRSVLSADGWMRTGDIAAIDQNGFVSIVDRKKEIIINSSGKNMSPAFIESTVKAETSLIGQVIAVGEGRKYVTGLITLEPEAVPRLVEKYHLQGASAAEISQHPGVLAEIDDAVARANARMNSNEQLKKYTVLPVSWTPDGDELTPTGKLKRRVVHQKYAEQIESMYG